MDLLRNPEKRQGHLKTFTQPGRSGERARAPVRTSGTFDLWTLTLCRPAAPQRPGPTPPAPRPSPARTPPSPPGRPASRCCGGASCVKSKPGKPRPTFCMFSSSISTCDLKRDAWSGFKRRVLRSAVEMVERCKCNEGLWLTQRAGGRRGRTR